MIHRLSRHLPRRPSRRRLPAIVLALSLGLGAVHSGHAIAGEDAELSNVLRRKLLALRSRGDFGAAVGLAEELFSTVRSDPTARRDQIQDAEWTLRTIRRLAALPESLAARMVEVDALTAEVPSLTRQRRYDDALTALETILTGQNEILGPLHPETARTLVELARVTGDAGRLATADSLFRRALSIQKHVYDGEHPAIAAALSSRARLLLRMRALASADSCATEALVQNARVFGTADPVVASSLDLLAEVRLELRDFESAATLLRRGLEVLRDRYGSEDPRVVRMSKALADVLARTGDRTGAAALYRAALDTQRRRYGESHLHVALLRRDLARSLVDLGEYSRAESMYRKSLDILRMRLGTQHDVVAGQLEELAMVLLELGQPRTAETRLDEALAIYRNLYGPGQVAEANVLLKYGIIAREEGRSETATDFFRRASQIYRRKLGESSPRFALAVYHWARMLTSAGQHAEASALLRHACDVFDISRRRRSVTVPTDPSPYELLALNELRQKHGDAAWLAIERHHMQQMVRRFDTRWFRRLTTPELIREVDIDERLSRMEREIGRTTRMESSTAVEDSLRIRLLGTQSMWTSLEEKLRRRYPVAEGVADDLGRVQAALKPGEAFLGWLDVLQNHYAYLVRPNGPVIWRSLPSPAGRAAYGGLRTALEHPGQIGAPVDSLALEVYRRRLAPFGPLLQSVEQLVVIPSGPMANIPVEALPSGTGKTIGDRCSVSYAPSSTLVLSIPGRHDRAASSLLSVSDPPFNSEHARDMFLANRTVPIAGGPRATIYAPILSGVADSIEALPRLAHTRDETRAISAWFDRKTVLVGRAASEARIADLAASQRLSDFTCIHLGTYAIVDPARPENSSLILSQVDIPGAMVSITRGQPACDGRITAGEIAREWRLRAETVTLSRVCRPDEDASVPCGGLAAALIRAGARSVVLNRWALPPEPAALCLSFYYENLVSRGLAPGAALAQAKLGVRDWRNAAGERPYAQPSYWAAFVLVGNPD